MNRTAFISVILLVVTCSCSLQANPFSEGIKRVTEGSQKQDLEGEFAQTLLKALQLSPQKEGTITNWNQITPALKADVWSRFEQEFLQYPQTVRGFKTSLWEKYVFLEPGLKVPDQSWATGGDLVMLQVGAPAQSNTRYAIWYDQSGDYHVYPFLLSSVQGWFVQKGKELPQPCIDLAPATLPGWRSDASARKSSQVGYGLFVVCLSLFSIFSVTAFRYFTRRK